MRTPACAELFVHYPMWEDQRQKICYTSGTLKICPNLKENVWLFYLATDADYCMIVGGYFNVSVMSPNISIILPMFL